MLSLSPARWSAAALLALALALPCDMSAAATPKFTPKVAARATSAKNTKAATGGKKTSTKNTKSAAHTKAASGKSSTKTKKTPASKTAVSNSSTKATTSAANAKPLRKPPYKLGTVALPEVTPVRIASKRYVLANGVRVMLESNPTASNLAVSLGVSAGRVFETASQRGYSDALFALMRAGSASGHTGRTSSERNLETMIFTTTGTASGLARVVRLHADRVRAVPKGDVMIPATWNQTPTLRVEALAYQGCRACVDGLSVSSSPPGHVSASAFRAFRAQQLQGHRIVVTVAGNFDERRALGLVTEAFAKMPSGSTRPAINLVVPEQTNQRVDHIGSAACGALSAVHLSATTTSTSPSFLYGWLVAPAGHEDLAAIRIVMQLLENAATWEGPARAERLAGFPANTRLSASLDERSHASLLLLRVEAPTASELEDARKLVDKMLLDLSTYGPDERETLAAWSVVHAWYLAQLADSASRASWLTRAELTGTGAASLARVMQPLATTNRNEIRAAARKYFSPIRRNFVEYAPPPNTNKACNEN